MVAMGMIQVPPNNTLCGTYFSVLKSVKIHRDYNDANIYQSDCVQPIQDGVLIMHYVKILETALIQQCVLLEPGSLVWR